MYIIVIKIEGVFHSNDKVLLLESAWKVLEFLHEKCVFFLQD